MAITNFTGSGKQTGEFLQLLCSASMAGGIQEQLTYISGINIFLAITAFLGNTLILVALRKEYSLHPPSKLLYRCLAATDLCVGLIAEPLYVIHLMESLSLRIRLLSHSRLHFVFGLFVNNDCN